MKPMILVSLIATTPAFAQCPVGADLQNGIRAIESDGVSHVYTAQRNGIVEVEINSSDGYVSRNLLAQGNHLLQLADVENGMLVPSSITNYSYSTPPATLPVPSANAVWNTQTIVREGLEIYREIQTQTWGATFDLTIGACTYDAIPGKLRYEREDYSIDEGVYFIPELGFSLLYSYNDDQSTEPDIYTIVLIEAVN
ncbi:hypothetical protein N9741_04330 [Octadecabacter sp.]|nr:hypothetical protein [Octadecabacter sp.]